MSSSGQSRRRPELLPGRVYLRPVCAQRESFCFRKASSFQNLGWGQGRNKGHRERRNESQGEWKGLGVTEGHVVGPLCSFPKPLVTQPVKLVWPPPWPPCPWWQPFAADGIGLNVIYWVGPAGPQRLLVSTAQPCSCPPGFLAGPCFVRDQGDR